MRKSLSITVISLAVLTLWYTVCFAQTAAGASSQPAVGAVSPAQVDVPPSGYRFQTEDVMKISVWGEPNFSADQVVDPSGFISVPNLAPIRAAGLTISELTDQIKLGLRRYLTDPKVKIEVIQFRKPKVHVLGLVNKPGLYEFKAGDRVMEAIAKAGSYMENAALQNVTLTRGSQEMHLDLDKLLYQGDLTQDIELQDCDSVFVPEDTAAKFSVVGQVLRQGQFKLKKDITVMDAISSAGGPTERAQLDQTYVLRGDMKKPQRIHVNMKKFMNKADISQNIALQPGDVVYVSETKKPNWDNVSRVLSSIVNGTYLWRLLGL